MTNHPSEIPLGKQSEYPQNYDASLLFPVPRQIKRDELHIFGDLPFCGEDVWNGYELSWLNLRGKPVVALGRFRIPCVSEFLIESKLRWNYLLSTIFNSGKWNVYRVVALMSLI